MADLIHLDQDMYGMQNDPINMALRRYAGMAVTNLTFGDVVNKVPTDEDPHRLSVAALFMSRLAFRLNEPNSLNRRGGGVRPPAGDPVLQEELPPGSGGPAGLGQRGAPSGGLQHPEESVLEGRHQQQESPP